MAEVAGSLEPGVVSGPMSGAVEGEFQPQKSNSAASLVRSEGRDTGIVRFEREVSAFFIDAAEMLGIPKSVAAIYGICFASAEPLSFADINARLDISQGSISQGLRVLAEVGALKKVGSHDRRDYYAPDMDLRSLATHFIEERLEKQLKAGKARLEAIKEAIPGNDGGAGKELSVRLKYLQSWHDKARGLIPLAKTFLKLS